jgi:hypothetical protein
MQLRNGTKYSTTTFEDFKAASLAIADGADSTLHHSYKMFRHINSEFPQMYYKMGKYAANYNRGRNLYVVTAYQKCTELITTILRHAYERTAEITPKHKQHIVLTLYELNLTKETMRRLIWGNVIQQEEVKEAMCGIDIYAIDESKFETKLYRCLMHMYDIDSSNASASYGWFDKYKKTHGDTSNTEMHNNADIYDYYYSGDGYAENDTYIMSYEKCFVKPIESLNSLFWM